MRGHPRFPPLYPPPLREEGGGRNRRCLLLAASDYAPYLRLVGQLIGAAWACSAGVGRFNSSCGNVIRRESSCPAGCVVSAPLPSLSGPPLARGRLPDGGGTFLRKGHLRFPFPTPSLLEFRAAGIHFPWPPSGS